MKLIIETWSAYRIDNPYNTDEIRAYTCKEKYYFMNADKGTQSKIFKIPLGKAGLKIKWHKQIQTELYTGRKHLFIQEGIKEQDNKEEEN